ncbi:protein epidermal patterning factor 1, partial [Nicotiana attenuata]
NTNIIIVLVFLPVVMNASHIRKLKSLSCRNPPPLISKKKEIPRANISWKTRPLMRQKRADILAIAGSRLPDCSHACGSCKPCRLVMVSFVCSSLEEAETCPVAYKCMCHNKSYPFP